MELYELIDDPRDRYVIKDELLYGNTADLKAVNEYKNIREMLIGELIKLPQPLNNPNKITKTFFIKFSSFYK